MKFCWILDSGGAARGAWQGGVIHEFMQWSRRHGCYPETSMGASAGGYAAADVATGTEQTVMKGWGHWGTGGPGGTEDTRGAGAKESTARHRFGKWGRFRDHLHRSIQYVMAEKEVSAIFKNSSPRKLLLFTTRVRRLDQKPIGAIDLFRFFAKSLTRKLPRSMKYLPKGYLEDPVVFATSLPPRFSSEYIRPLTRENYHGVIEASCLVPLAMGLPMAPGEVGANGRTHRGDANARFMDGGFALKMPMARFQEDPRFQCLHHFVGPTKTVIFCCDPAGNLWETSSRLRRLNDYPPVARALEDGHILVIAPDHKIEAGFLCLDNPTIMRTFERGQQQGANLLRSDKVRRFFEI